jgi:hypothetical protein
MPRNCLIETDPFRCALAAATVACGVAAIAPGASATDLLSSLQAPIFGGGNNAAFTNAQFAVGLQATKAANAAAAKAAAAAAATAAANSGPNAQFVSAITSQLTGLVAESIAQKIANTTSGGGGTIQSGSTSITYTNVDGELTVDIVSPSGATTLTIPTVN